MEHLNFRSKTDGFRFPLEIHWLSIGKQWKAVDFDQNLKNKENLGFCLKSISFPMEILWEFWELPWNPLQGATFLWAARAARRPRRCRVPRDLVKGPLGNKGQRICTHSTDILTLPPRLAAVFKRGFRWKFKGSILRKQCYYARVKKTGGQGGGEQIWWAGGQEENI